MVGNVENLIRPGIATTEHRHVRSLRWRPSQGGLQHLTRDAELGLDLHANDVSEKLDDVLAEWLRITTWWS